MNKLALIQRTSMNYTIFCSFSVILMGVFRWGGRRGGFPPPRLSSRKKVRKKGGIGKDERKRRKEGESNNR